VVGDTVFEGDETFSLVLSSPANGTLGAGQEQATATISDDDAAPSFSITPASYAEGTACNNNSGGLVVALSGAAVRIGMGWLKGIGASVCVRVCVCECAVLAALSGQLRQGVHPFAPAACLCSWEDRPRGDPQRGLRLQGPMGSGGGLSPPPLTRVVCLSALAPHQGFPVSVDFSAASGAFPASFAPKAGSVTFQPGDTSQSVPFTWACDGAAADDRAVTITLSNPTGPLSVSATNGAATLTVQDDDAVRRLGLARARARAGIKGMVAV
jgi:hypothetical protein